MSPIYNYEVYKDAMKRGMYDKMFFVDKIDPTMIVDFGCADGTLMEEIQPYFPDIPIIGVDNDAEMRETTKAKGFLTFNNLELEGVHIPKGSAIVLSSVLHEVYSYCTPEEIVSFWNEVRRFDYIVIRDMCVTHETKHIRVTNVDEVLKPYQDQAADFEKVWGKIDTLDSYLHFLLKYMYTDNWEREVKENYLPNTMEALVHLAKGDDHSIVYHNHSTLPYLRDKWRNDIGIVVDTPTHLKMIVERI